MTAAVLATRNLHHVSCVCFTAENSESYFCKRQGEQQVRLHSHRVVIYSGVGLQMYPFCVINLRGKKGRMKYNDIKEKRKKKK